MPDSYHQKTARTDHLLHTGRSSRRSFPRYFLPAYILLIIYISLSPFSGWDYPAKGPFHFLTAAWPRYITGFDIVANELAYVPLGILLFELLGARLPRWIAGILSTIIGFLLSFCMEALQAYLPVRISSFTDLLCNTGGVLAGVLIAMRMGHSWLAKTLVRWRHKTFSESPGSEFGELLLVVWLFIQLNPSIPFFAAGTINNVLDWNPIRGEPLYLLPQALGVAFNFCGICLFMTVLLKPKVDSLRFVIGIVILGASLKYLSAGVLLKSALITDWFGIEALGGLAGGLLMLMIANRLSHRWRIYLAAMMILAGGLLAKVGAIYDALPTILNVFDWPHGQLFNFTSLTLILNEIWPVVTFIYLIVCFNRLPSSDSQKKYFPST